MLSGRLVSVAAVGTPVSPMAERIAGTIG